MEKIIFNHRFITMIISLGALVSVAQGEDAANSSSDDKVAKKEAAAKEEKNESAEEKAKESERNEAKKKKAAEVELKEPKKEDLKEPKKNEAKEPVKEESKKTEAKESVKEEKKEEPKKAEAKEAPKEEPKKVEAKESVKKVKKEKPKTEEKEPAPHHEQTDAEREAAHEKLIHHLRAEHKKMGDRLACVEQTIANDKKSDFKDYGRIGDSKMNVNFSGNLNAFGVFYPKQRPNSTNFVTDARYVLFDNQIDTNNNNLIPSKNTNHFGFSGDGSTFSTKLKTPTENGDFYAQFDIGVSLDAQQNVTTNASLNVSDAHIEYMNFVVGYTYSNFSDPNSLGSWMNVLGLQESNLPYSPLLVQYNFEMSKNVTLRLAVESPTNDGLEQYSGNVASGNAADSVKISRFGKSQEPALTAQVVYTNDDAAFSLRFVERKLQQSFNDRTNDVNLSARGYGVGMSGKYNVMGKSNVYFQTAYGKGIGSYIGELTNYGFLFDSTKTGGSYKFEALKAYSFLIGTQVYVNDNLYVNLAYQQNGVSYPDFALNAGNTNTDLAAPNLDTKHQKIMANIIYAMNDHFTFGLETTFVTRNIRNAINGQSSAKANTIMVGMKYSF